MLKLITISLLLLNLAIAQMQKPMDMPHAEMDHDDMTLCRFAPAIKFSELAPAVLMTGVGNSQFKVSTKSNEAQKFIDQGINMLHSFWDLEAYRSFKKATELDPNCAIAYWGLFNSITQTSGEMREERQNALKKAEELMVNATDREQRYIKATRARFKGKDQYIEEMEALIDAYPEDVQAKLFLANTLSSGVATYKADGSPAPGKLYGQMILKDVLHTHPDLAAAHHYWIHAVENGPRPEIALESAARVAQMAPHVGHMVHMPGHIYFRIGEFQKAIDAFLQSMKVDSAYMKDYDMNPINNWNYTHNLDYLIATYAENGNLDEGLRWAKAVREMELDKDRSMAGGLSYILFGTYTAHTRLYIRYQIWDDALKSIDELLEKEIELKTIASEYYKGMRFYILGMQAFKNKDSKVINESIVQLNALLEKLNGVRPEIAGDWYFRFALKILNVNAKELQGLSLSLQNKTNEAITALENANTEERDIGYWEPPHYVRPVLESLAEVYSRAGKKKEAIATYQRALKLRPNNVHSLNALKRLSAN
ncbi:MAG: tetratricopeptide repeat protein [Calditrichaeota bacterium]|nr:tetratricopeptide repeat protein [Calditrichota bacterium]